jgi:prepilin-type processing-associated H-X9-DG protein
LRVDLGVTGATTKYRHSGGKGLNVLLWDGHVEMAPSLIRFKYKWGLTSAVDGY